MRVLSIFILSTIFLALSSSAQTSPPLLHLSDAINAALTNNREITLAAIDESIAANNLRQTDAYFLPRLSFSYTAIRTDNPLNAFGFKLQQQIVTQNDFNPALLNHPGGVSDITTRLDLQQPLLNADLLYKRQAAAAQVLLYKFKTQRSTEWIRFNTEQAYLRLQLAWRAAALAEQALQTATSVHEFTENHFKQGLVQKSDVLQAALQVTTARAAMENAQSNIRNSAEMLSVLMGNDSLGNFQTDTLSALDAMAFTEAVPSARADFAAMEQAIHASDLMIKATKMSRLPALNAFGSYQFNDNRLLGFGAHTWLAGLQLAVPIFNGNSIRNSQQAQTLQRNRLQTQLEQQKQDAQRELNEAIRNFSDARNSYKRQQEAVEQANAALLIIKNRYEEGLAHTTDVLQAATQLSQQQFALAQSAYAGGLSAAYIRFLTTTQQQP